MVEAGKEKRASGIANRNFDRVLIYFPIVVKNTNRMLKCFLMTISLDLVLSNDAFSVSFICDHETIIILCTQIQCMCFCIVGSLVLNWTSAIHRRSVFLLFEVLYIFSVQKNRRLAAILTAKTLYYTLVG